ncbi:unnamed protein product [Agarophyton chilense]
MDRPTHTQLSPDVAPGSTLKYSATPLHPVQTIQANAHKAQQLTRRKLQAAAYGAALPMRAAMHQHMLSQCQRLPGLPSSYAGLDSFTGRDEKIDFEDFMNLPHHSPYMPQQQPREQLEQILGVTARSQAPL